VREVTRRLDEAGIDLSLHRQPGVQWPVSQAEHEVALENDLIGFSGLVRCQQNAFKHAFLTDPEQSTPRMR
jgi:hypothetical protein